LVKTNWLASPPLVVAYGLDCKKITYRWLFNILNHTTSS
jgi:aconitase A